MHGGEGRDRRGHQAVRPRGGRIRRDFRQNPARASVSGARQRYLLGLGSNLGDRVYHLNEAIRLLGQLPQAEVTAISPVFDSDPVGFNDQPSFLNLCLEMGCALKPAEL
ncbi:MAG: hypothetical protein EBV31_09960, partial [Verrucomicrobia bacterium]|nr:hypothetical protein [Verrucomicrobiota bacterium]